MKRKSFIKKLGIGGSSIALAPGLLSTACAQDKSAGKKMGVALVGLGNYSRGQLGPALLETEHCYLAGIVTGSPEKIPVWQKRFQFPDTSIYNYENFDTIADNPNIDIVYVVLPNSMHKEYVIRAANAGKHVICEKPMAINAKECEEMIAACKANNVKLSIGYRLHFDPYHQKIMKLAQTKPFGDIKVVRSELSFTIGDPKQWRLRKALAGGGAMYDVGIYSIQAARYATGEEPIAVQAQEYKTDKVKFAEVDETISFQIEFPSGAMAQCLSSYNAKNNRLHVSAGKNTYLIDPSFGYSGQAGKIGSDAMEFPHVNQQAKQMDGFALNIKNNTESKINGEEGLHDIKILEAVYRSIDKGGVKVKI